MNDLRVRLFIVAQLFISSNLFACVWAPDNGLKLYWPSTKIKVCFVKQVLIEQSKSGLIYNNTGDRTRRIFIDAIQEISDKTNFEFYDFGQCEINSQEASIRINITRRQGEGKAESVGPNSAYGDSFNMSLSQIPSNFIQDIFNQQTGETRVFNHLTWAKTAAQHEVMHLLGFHHDLPRDAKGWDIFVSNLGDVKLIDNELDSLSVMSISSHGPELSNRDISCINELADRTIEFNSLN